MSLTLTQVQTVAHDEALEFSDEEADKIVVATATPKPRNIAQEQADEHTAVRARAIREVEHALANGYKEIPPGDLAVILYTSELGQKIKEAEQAFEKVFTTTEGKQKVIGKVDDKAMLKLSLLEAQMHAIKEWDKNRKEGCWFAVTNPNTGEPLNAADIKADAQMIEDRMARPFKAQFKKGWTDGVDLLVNKGLIIEKGKEAMVVDNLALPMGNAKYRNAVRNVLVQKEALQTYAFLLKRNADTAHFYARDQFIDHLDKTITEQEAKLVNTKKEIATTIDNINQVILGVGVGLEILKENLADLKLKAFELDVAISARQEVKLFIKGGHNPEASVGGDLDQISLEFTKYVQDAFWLTFVDPTQYSKNTATPNIKQ
jgi:hypothetical protein